MPASRPSEAERQTGEAAGFGGNLPARAIKILRWRAMPNDAGTALGTFDLRLLSGLELYDFKLGVGSQGTRYILVPATQMRDRNDRILLDDRGKTRWRQFVGFDGQVVRERFSAQVLAVLRQAHPELFVGEPQG